MNNKIKTHCDLEVDQKARATAMELFEHSKKSPREETDFLTDQVRRSSRSVCANLAAAWRKRRYEAAFIAEIPEAETEAAETQLWIEFAVKCASVDRDAGAALYKQCDEILGTLGGMIDHVETWLVC